MCGSVLIGENIEDVKINHCNNTVTQKLGYSKEEVISMDTLDLYHPDCWSEARKMREYCFKHGYVSNWELQLKKKNGGKTQVSLNSKAIKDKQGRIIGGIGLWRDNTDLIETRHQLHETNNLLTRQNEEIKTLMHIMSHDIQSPTRAIGNFAQFILEGDKENLSALTLSFLHKLQLNIRRMHYLTQDIISYFFKSSLENIKKINFKDIIDQVLAYINLPSPIKIHLKGDIQPFKAKRTPLAQIFSNLISNAIKYHHNPDETEIDIEALDNKRNITFYH